MQKMPNLLHVRIKPVQIDDLIMRSSRPKSAVLIFICMLKVNLSNNIKILDYSDQFFLLFNILLVSHYYFLLNFRSNKLMVYPIQI